MIFYLGTDRPHWLAQFDVPLFVSRRVLCRLKKLPRAKTVWGLDSGAFSELRMFGAWQTSPEQYVAEVRRYRDEVGLLQWAAIQDWMCEPFMLAKTGLSLPEHQRRTVASYLELKSMAPDLPWVPVLQGWGPGDYLRHRDEFDRAGVDLRSLPLVGLGSVCRRQNTFAAEELIREFHTQGVKLHGFGFKITGLRRAARYLTSADSMAWCLRAAYRDPLPGCQHRNCCHCPKFALWWRSGVMRAVAGSQSCEQGVMW